MGRMGVGTRKDDSAIIRWQLPVMARNSGPHGDHAISEDDLRRSEKELQKLTDQFVAEVDEILGHKEKELLEV